MIFVAPFASVTAAVVKARKTSIITTVPTARSAPISRLSTRIFKAPHELDLTESEQRAVAQNPKSHAARVVRKWRARNDPPPTPALARRCRSIVLQQIGS